jgi:hypothetical protein
LRMMTSVRPSPSCTTKDARLQRMTVSRCGTTGNTDALDALDEDRVRIVAGGFLNIGHRLRSFARFFCVSACEIEK